MTQSGELKRAIVPKSSLSKLSCIPNAEFYGVDNLKECIDFFTSSEIGTPASISTFEHSYLQSGDDKFYYQKKYPLDFNDIKGQDNAKRAALISATGMHNILLEGNPGCGKSMIAKRLAYILPPLHMNEILENAKLNALEGVEPDFSPIRPFRHPHHTSTQASIFGGGSLHSKIGEVGLATSASCFLMSCHTFPRMSLKHYVSL